MRESRSLPSETIGEIGVATYCKKCLKRINRGLRRNSMPVVSARECMRGEHFACFGCAYLSDGVVVAS